MIAGIIGVPVGSYLAQTLRKRTTQWDPLICAWGLFISTPMAYFTLITSHHSTSWCFLFVFLAEVTLNLCWSIIADILLVSTGSFKQVWNEKSSIRSTATLTNILNASFSTETSSFFARKINYSKLWLIYKKILYFSHYRVSFTFGALTMISGVIGVPLGSVLSTMLVKRFPKIDPLICSAGLFLSAPLLALCMILVSKNSIAAYILLFIGEVAVNLNWAINADILLVRD